MEQCLLQRGCVAILLTAKAASTRTKTEKSLPNDVHNSRQNARPVAG
jgi:hypothetical protein